MKTKLLIVTVFALFFVSCEKYGYLAGGLGGTQSPMGEVGNTFTYSSPPGVSNASASVTDLTDGVSTMTYSVDITDAQLKVLAGKINGANLNGNTLSGSVKGKFTSEGIETIHKDGKLILVKYNASVGDKYTLKTDEGTITREVTSKSTEDDYFWGWMLIKTMVIKETGLSTPGVSYIEYVANHKFGIVGANLHLIDGTVKSISIFSSANN